ncbi:hypothetical protein [Bacillus pumilus]|uniref:hypothetical protein n=1 Tax=Bacillus pumilus TaxID=1408 RepID=UPI00227E0F1B|nr:hypothetical protein [Bacillus pumilus]MCY7500210.1 hypothetical protein [Bacillus pumilus]MCY7528466.1 hypothetical protein [Bacillus pumilus]MED4441491.1 hypothetical protein [Bacillus pumilus]MED4490019.1 hypothetical protein [Bacillus pumilus]
MSKWRIDYLINENIDHLAKNLFDADAIMNILKIDARTAFDRLFYLVSQNMLNAYLVWMKDGAQINSITFKEGKFDLNDFGGEEHPPLDELYVKFKISKEYKEFRDEWENAKRFKIRK